MRELFAILSCLMISIKKVYSKNTLSAQIPEKKDESICYGQWIVFVEYLIRRLFFRWTLSFYFSTFPESLEKWSGWELLEHCLKELTTKLWHDHGTIIRTVLYVCIIVHWHSAAKSYLLISLFFHFFSWGIAVIVVSDQNNVKRMETWAVNKILIFLTFCQS